MKKKLVKEISNMMVLRSKWIGINAVNTKNSPYVTSKVIYSTGKYMIKICLKNI